MIADCAILNYGRLAGPTWKAMRRAARDILSHEACMKHLPIQHAEAGQLMYDLLEHPKVHAH